jgi:hypothetical protein
MAHIPLGVAPPSQVIWIGIIRYIGTEKLKPYLIYLLSFGKKYSKVFYCTIYNLGHRGSGLGTHCCSPKCQQVFQRCCMAMEEKIMKQK